MATASATVEERVASLEERLIELFPPIEHMFTEPHLCDCGVCQCDLCLSQNCCGAEDCCRREEDSVVIAESTTNGVIQAIESLKTIAASGAEREAVRASELLLGWYTSTHR